MKPRRVEQVDRRRPRVELNLTGEVKKRTAGASRGCSSLIARLLGLALVILLVRSGLG